MALASNTRASDSDQQAPDGLICPASAIFDAERVRAEIDAEMPGAGTTRAGRAVAVKSLATALERGREAIREAFQQNPHDARPTTTSYAYLADGIVREAFRVATMHLHPLSNPTAGERLALIAVGGYGRAEMAPHSDIDLLFLTPWKVTPWAESVVESMLYMLWDLKLKVGHATRTVKDCIRLAAEDYTIRTSLVECRLLDGDADLAHRLTSRLWTDLFRSTASEFIEAKLAERAERHRKQGGQRYMVEPNVKEGKGGLRDLQSLYWIGKYLYNVSEARELVGHGLFTKSEFARFRAAADFLWAVRCHLHLITGRAADQLTFDLQVEVAEAMNYTDHSGRRAVEHFMQDYFRHAIHVGDLTRIFLVKMEETHVKTEPMLQRIFSRRKKARAPYAIQQNRLTIADRDAFLSNRLNMLHIFLESLRTGTLLHPDAMRLIAANLDLIDQDMRQDPNAAKIFLRLLLNHGNPERGLRRMNELGVLGAYIPEFGAIVAMMQFNMYHSYTVDEHTIQVISHLARIEKHELDDQLPVTSGIMTRGVNRRVIYLACLMHDLGKGQEEDHSIVGARIARSLGPRLGLKQGEADTVEWLVRNHLLMSDMAQKRDIADPRTVRGFAKAVGSVERLELLTVLTVCDISGVGPDVWNNWKAVLIRALYRQTKIALEDGMEALGREERGAVAKRNLREELSGWSERAIKAELARHYPPYWQGLHVTAHRDFAELLQGIGDDEVRILLTPDEDRDATRACFAMADHPGIFSRMCGALALSGANIVDARTFTTKDGYATAAFWIQDAEESPFEKSRLPRLTKAIQRILKGEIRTRDALAPRDKVKKRESAFRVPTHVTFDNDASDIYTVIEVDTRDRPGLLFDLTQVLAQANVSIASAVIATYGEQVVDAFYVKDMFGLKLYDEQRRKQLEKKLRDAIESGTKRARA